MNPEPTLRPYGNADPDRSGPSPHLSECWQVVSRRLWLVLLVFGVTTASAIWAVSRQRIYYQSHLSLQVNDPAQPARGLTPGRISGLDIFVDPIESEIQVLRSTPIAAAVVDSLGLGLRPASDDRVRSDLFRDMRVEQGAPDGSVLATAEVVIIDSPPVLAVTDAAILAVHTDGVVLVLRSGETEQRPAERSVEQLRRLGVRVFGAVLNEVSATTTEEGYDLQYYYAYQPTGEAEEKWARLREGLSRARFWSR